MFDTRLNHTDCDTVLTRTANKKPNHDNLQLNIIKTFWYEVRPRAWLLYQQLIVLTALPKGLFTCLSVKQHNLMIMHCSPKSSIICLVIFCIPQYFIYNMYCLMFNQLKQLPFQLQTYVSFMSKSNSQKWKNFNRIVNFNNHKPTTTK